MGRTGALGRKTISAAVRLALLIRQDHRCNICSIWLRTSVEDIPMYDIDHRVRHCETQNDSSENLQAICLNCHRIKTSKEARQAATLLGAQKRESRLLNNRFAAFAFMEKKSKHPT